MRHSDRIFNRRTPPRPTPLHRPISAVSLSIEAACARAERICNSFADDCRLIRNHQVNATVSGGVSVSVNAEQTLEGLLEYSDAALYLAKAEGRNRIKRSDQPTPERGLSNVVRVA